MKRNPKPVPARRASAKIVMSQDFSGLCVVAFESRKAEEMRRLIRRFGGEPLVAPSMREVPLENQREALTFGERLFAGQIDILILLTGVGTRTLVQALSTKYPKDTVVRALSQLTLVVRGPKPIVALAELELKPTLAVPEPNTWRDLLTLLDRQLPVKGRRVAVQEYGTTNAELLEGLQQRGATVLRVPVYRWALPEDVEPLRQAITAICEGRADVLLFTSAHQVDNVVDVATTMGCVPLLTRAAARCVVASIGPVCSETLTRHGFPVDLEPRHPHMGSLLAEASQKSHEVLRTKRPAS